MFLNSAFFNLHFTDCVASLAEADTEPRPTSKVGHFCKTVNAKSQLILLMPGFLSLTAIFGIYLASMKSYLFKVNDET